MEGPRWKSVLPPKGGCWGTMRMHCVSWISMLPEHQPWPSLVQGTRGPKCLQHGLDPSLGSNQKGRQACNQASITLFGKCQGEERPWRLGEPEVVASICAWVGESFWKSFQGRQGRKSVQSGRTQARASVCREWCGMVAAGRDVRRGHPSSGDYAGP